MIRARAIAAGGYPALLRLSRLAPLGPEDRATITRAIDAAQVTRAHREILVERREIRGPRLIVGGWAARVRTLVDGRRQFLSFLLPGDLIGLCHHPRPLALTTVVALTDVAHCPAPHDTAPQDAAPQDAAGATIKEAYARSQAMEAAYLLAQITRLGRMTAQERIADLFLELHERLTLAGLTRGTAFELPLTQESLGDALGLTAVHVNRTLQTLRRSGDIDMAGRQVTLRDPAALARSVGRSPIRVSADDPDPHRPALD